MTSNVNGQTFSGRNALSIVQIGACDEPRLFSLEEAQELLPLVRRMTAAAYDELQPVKQRLENMLASDPRINKIEAEYERIVRGWVAKMERLGLVVKGLWLLDFDTGDGYLCWKYPELRIAWFHDYQSGFAERQKLAEVIENFAPEWA